MRLTSTFSEIGYVRGNERNIVGAPVRETLPYRVRRVKKLATRRPRLRAVTLARTVYHAAEIIAQS